MAPPRRNASKKAGILDIALEVRIQIWEKLCIRDQKRLRETCTTFQSDIDYLVGVNGILDGSSTNVDWITRIRLKKLKIIGKDFTQLWERTHASIFFNELGGMLQKCHPNLSKLHLTIDNFNMNGFDGEGLRDLQVSTCMLTSSNLTEFESFLGKQHRLQRLVCELGVTWAFYVRVLWNCSQTLTTVELGHIPTMTGVSIDILNWSKLPVLPRLNTFKLRSSTPIYLPYPLYCLHSINFPIFHLSGITELGLIHVKLRELDILLILSETESRLRTVNLQYFLTRVSDLHARLENSLREGKLDSLIMCDTLAVTMDQMMSNESLRRDCRKFGYIFTWEYPLENQGYGYKLQLTKRNYAEFQQVRLASGGCFAQ